MIEIKTETKKLLALVSRNTKCYFKDKFLFFISLITPLILLVLFATFLRNVYISSFKQAIDGTGIELENRVMEGMAAAWLMSSVLSVSAVTVAFCSNTIMIDDKINNIVTDFMVSPVKRTSIQISYFISNFFVTFLVLIVVMFIGHIYLAIVGWYIPFTDALMIIVDIICCILFGTLLAALVESFINSQGGLSAVSTLVSSLYGFISGAYMPLSQFAEGLRNFLCMLPSIYGVGMLRNHYMNGYLQKLSDSGIPAEAVEAIRDSFDANLYLFGNQIPLGAMYGILLGSCAVLFVAFILLVLIKNNKLRRKK